MNRVYKGSERMVCLHVCLYTELIACSYSHSLSLSVILDDDTQRTIYSILIREKIQNPFGQTIKQTNNAGPARRVNTAASGGEFFDRVFWDTKGGCRKAVQNKTSAVV